MTATGFDRIGVIAHRDLRLQLSYPFELVSSLWGVLISVFMFFFIGRLVGDSPLLAGYEGGYFAYAVVGITAMTLSFTLLEVFRSTISYEQSAGTLELLLAGPTPLRTLLTGSLVMPVVFTGIQALAYGLLGWIIDPDALGPLAWLRATPALALMMVTFAALGLWSAAFVIVAQRGDPFGAAIVQATNLIAGAVFPVGVLPEWMQALAHLIPTFYGFNALRGLMLEGDSFRAVLDDLLILAAYNLVLLAVGAVMFRRALSFARRMGTLGTS